MSIELRVARPDDAEEIQAIYAPIVQNTPISFEEVTPTVEDMRQRISTTLKTYPFLVATREGRVIGYAYASQHRARAAYRWAVDVTVYIAQSDRRAGVGRSLYAALLPILTRQGFRSAYAGISLPNAESVGLHERVGFKPIGIFSEVGFKLGEWHDVGYWCYVLTGATTPPSKIQPFNAFNE